LPNTGQVDAFASVRAAASNSHFDAQPKKTDLQFRVEAIGQLQIYEWIEEAVLSH
jgi:hypothetical protein